MTGDAETALVDSAYDQMGINSLLQQMTVLVSILIPTLTVFLTTKIIGLVGAFVVVVIATILFLCAMYTVMLGSYQSAKAVELIVMHRANQGSSSKLEPSRLDTPEFQPENKQNRRTVSTNNLQSTGAKKFLLTLLLVCSLIDLVYKRRWTAREKATQSL